MIAHPTRWQSKFVALATPLIVTCIGFVPAAIAQSNLPQHYYMCKKDLMVGGKLNTYITGVNWADQDFTTDKLGVAPEAYGKAFVRYLIDRYKPADAASLEMESYNWGQTCATSWPWGREGLEKSHKYTLSLGLAVEIDWEYKPDRDAPAAPPG